MWKYTMEVFGLMCGMCESSVNDAIRRSFDVKKVTTTRSKNQTIIITAQDIPEEALRKCIEPLGHDVGKITKEPYEKKGFLAGLFGK